MRKTEHKPSAPLQKLSKIFFQPEKKSSSQNKFANTQDHQSKINDSGKKLSSSEKTFFEKKFDHDFSDVRIHTDTKANQSAKKINAKAFTQGNNIVFGEGYYQPSNSSSKKLMAHELAHVIQQKSIGGERIQAKRELDITNDEEKKIYPKCLAQIGIVISKLEENSKAGMPDDIKEAVTLLRKKYTENKIKCYYMDGNVKGETNFTTGDIYMDAKTLEGSPDIFANIGEGTVLHEGTHALHNEKFPNVTKKYGKALDEKNAGTAGPISAADDKEFKRLDAYTEYWAYRKMQEYDNSKNKVVKTEDEVHNDTLKSMRSHGGIAPMNAVKTVDPNFDPRKWSPKN